MLIKMSLQEIALSTINFFANINFWTWISLVVFLLYFYWRLRPHAKFPPGPIGFPIVGVLPNLSKSPTKDFKKWSLELYGPVMSVRLGMNEVVVLNTYDVIYKAFVKQGNKFSDRARNELIYRNTGYDGIIFRKYDENFKTQKHFALKFFREKGLGRPRFESMINEEGNRFIEHLKNIQKSDDTFDFKEYLYLLTSNVIMQIAFGKRHDYTDEDFIKLLNTLEMLFADPKHAKKLTMLSFIGFLARIPPFSEATRVFGMRMLDILGFMKNRIEEHKNRFDRDNIHDYIDAFIYEQKNGITPQQSRFTDAQLVATCRDLFVAGSETSSTTLTWLFIHYLHFPDYQKQIKDEIDKTFGTSGTPLMSKRLDLPVTCAFIQEVMRIKTIVHMGVDHCTSSQVELEGFVMPKGTRVISNLDGANMDPETWPDPERFDPHRHIDEEGKFVASNKIIPFSIGPRFCLGESLARVEIFFFFVKIIQNFNIRSANGKLPPLDAIVSTLVVPRECKVKLELRR